ncbi:MAG: PilW family protein [Deltaproteobacteria bacterium]|nr:PilW family protein [Deltaproteobacteria bacterium]
MKGTSRGFSLIEILVVMAILCIVIMMGSETFMATIKGARRETGSSMTQIELTVALNYIRYDVEHAGYGLCRKFMGNIRYEEARDLEISHLNDAPSGIPRPIISDNNKGMNGSDRLVIKSVLAGTNETCTKWTYVKFGEPPKMWDDAKLRLKNNERVIVIKPGRGKERIDELVMDPNGSFFTLFKVEGLGPNFSPKTENERYIIYGVDPDTNLRMPFNRTDYFIRVPSSGMPSRCAPNTGILYKATLNHSDGRFTYLPIMDCVADFQVIFGVDLNGDGLLDSYIDDVSTYDAETLRKRIKEVRLYILTHIGKKDADYSFNQDRIYVGEFGKGRELNLPQVLGQTYRNYRWKIYSVAVQPKNLQ